MPLGVQPKTEEFLYFLLWSAEQLMRPTFRNLSDSYEGWAYRNGMLRQLAMLEKQRLVERKNVASDARLYRLTGEGRLHALGGRDPERQWSRAWDGSWRLVLFDVPLGEDVRRARLRRSLRTRGFGHLQNSVWITPDPMEEEVAMMRGARIDVESLILLEARPCAGESDAEIVAGAWDFGRLNRLFGRHLQVLDARPAGKLTKPAEAKALQRWAMAERAAWINAISIDPLLPRRLLPADYIGQRAWRRRIEVLKEAREDLLTFNPTLACKGK